MAIQAKANLLVALPHSTTPVFDVGLMHPGGWGPKPVFGHTGSCLSSQAFFSPEFFLPPLSMDTPQ